MDGKEINKKTSKKKDKPSPKENTQKNTNNKQTKDLSAVAMASCKPRKAQSQGQNATAGDCCL